MAWAIVGLVASGLAVVVGGGFGVSMWRRRWTIADTPTSDAAHVFVGTNEVVGRAAAIGQPLVAPYSAVEAVWYRSLLEKEVRNDNGRGSWRTVSEETSTAPFWVEDHTGRVLVRPGGASVYARDRRQDTHPGLPERYDRMTLLRQLRAHESGELPPLTLTSAPRHRTTEWILRPGEDLYVLGDAAIRSDAVALEFVAGRGPQGRTRRLLVSAGDQQETATRTTWQGIGLFVVLLAGAVALPAAWHAVRTAGGAGPQPGDPGTLEAVGGWMVAAAMLVFAALPIVYLVRLHNRLVDTRNRVEAAWGLVDVQLRRRHDLIPALAAAVAGAVDHERATVEAVVAARRGAPTARLDGAMPDEAELAAHAEVDRRDRAAARELLAIVEAYPELRTDAHHRQLADQLVETEDAVAFARTFYNDAVTVMRDRREQLPGRLLAWAVPAPSLGLWQPEEPPARPVDAPAPVGPDALAGALDAEEPGPV